jgi:hypothetical protein
LETHLAEAMLGGHTMEVRGMIERRVFLLAGGALVWPAGWASAWAAAATPQPGADLPVPASGSLGFRIMRKGDVIGTHTLAFSQKGRTDQPAPADQKPPQGTAATPAKPPPAVKPPPPLGPLTVHIVVDIVVRLGPLPLYRYNHSNIETWVGDTLQGFAATTNDNGTRKQVVARRENGPLMVEAGKLHYAAPLEAIGNTYWNPRTLKVPLIDTEEGRLLAPHVADQGVAPVQRADGRDITAQHYALSGDLAVELWYADAKPAPNWVALALTGRDGSRITYELL